MAERADGPPPAIRSLPRGHSDYPSAALDLSDPPETFYWRGRWPIPGDFVAIVGARAATPYGIHVAERLAADLARLGAVVVSGLAHGIDAAAHRGALAVEGATVAIVPGGLDAIVPVGHRPLAESIVERGAVLSEHARGEPVHKATFLVRNRLIAALSRAVVVVEARERSGALNTAAHALKLGRPLLAVPGDVDRDSSRGCHLLLRNGARVCESAADVMAAVHGPGRAATAAAPGPAPKPAAAPAAPMRVLASLESGARTVETCARECGLALAETQRILLELEWSGLARWMPGGRWVRRSS